MARLNLPSRMCRVKALRSVFPFVVRTRSTTGIKYNALESLESRPTRDVKRYTGNRYYNFASELQLVECSEIAFEFENS